LLEDEHFPVAEKLVRDFLCRKGVRAEDWVVLNGLPRHVGQAEDMERLVNVRRVVELRCDEEVVFARIRGNVGGDRTARTDDDPAAIRAKLRLYRERTAPLLRFYETRGVPTMEIPVGPADSPQITAHCLEKQWP
jgi:adenylate kinase family enzyme